VVHPLGSLQIRQNLLPLGERLDRYSNAPIRGHNRFEISHLSINEERIKVEQIEEFFARGQFWELTTDERLSRDRLQSQILLE